jgi:hypothetical protein
MIRVTADLKVRTTTVVDDMGAGPERSHYTGRSAGLKACATRGCRPIFSQALQACPHPAEEVVCGERWLLH